MSTTPKVIGRLAELMGESVPEGAEILDEAPPPTKQVEVCPCCGQEIKRGKKARNKQGL